MVQASAVPLKGPLEYVSAIAGATASNRYRIVSRERDAVRMEGVPPWSATRPLPFSSLFPRLQHRIVTKVQLVPVLVFTAHGRYLLGQQPVEVRSAPTQAERPAPPSTLPIPRDRLTRFFVCRLAPFRLALVPVLLAFRQAQLHLYPAIAEVQPRRNQRQSLLL